MLYPVCQECGQVALPVSETLLVQSFGQVTNEMRDWMHLCERCRRRRYQKILKSGDQGGNKPDGY
jgi:hypothetical protein